jgi:hypothetical protein
MPFSTIRWIKEKSWGSARIFPSMRWDGGTALERDKPITIAGMLRQKLIKGPATPVSKRAFREETVLSMRITAPNVPKGGRGKGKKKGNVALIPYLRDIR